MTSLVIWIDRYLISDEMRGLISVIDCHFSLHRSEGLGLGIAESMYLGKPAIATAYSGNLEFMNFENSFLVPYQLVSVKKGEYLFGLGQSWAEPGINIAAAFMRDFYENQYLGIKMGSAASKYIRKHHSVRVASEAILARHDAIRKKSTNNSALLF